MPDKSEDRPPLEMPSFSLRPRKKDAPAEDTGEDTGEDTREGTAPHEDTPSEPAPDLSAPEPPSGSQLEPQAQPAQQPQRRARRRPLPAIRVSGLQAAILTGVVVGALALLLAWLAGVGCEAVRGTSSCGGGPGLLILLVVLAALAWEGAFVLRALGVPHAGSTSLLAVGILAVLVLVFLLGSLDEVWALIAVPMASAVAFAASWWVTTAVRDDDPAADTSSRTSYDVR